MNAQGAAEALVALDKDAQRPEFPAGRVAFDARTRFYHRHSVNLARALLVTLKALEKLDHENARKALKEVDTIPFL